MKLVVLTALKPRMLMILNLSTFKKIRALAKDSQSL